MKAEHPTPAREIDRLIEELRGDPQVGPILKEIHRRRRRRRWPGASGLMLEWLCSIEGRLKGGRPPWKQRCTKRLGTRYCWNWRAPGTDRCHLHPREGMLSFAKVVEAAGAEHVAAEMVERGPLTRSEALDRLQRVKGIGPDRAAALLDAYGDADGWLEDTPEGIEARTGGRIIAPLAERLQRRARALP